MFKISTIYFPKNNELHNRNNIKIISKAAIVVRRHWVALLAAGPHEATTATSTELYRCVLLRRNYRLSSHLMLTLIHVFSLLSFKGN